jgi:predicted ATPase/class 3 adenylate cyclase
MNCGFDNPNDVRFCVACGIALPRLCGSCGEVNPARFRFCGSCGAALADSAPARPPAPEADPEAAATPAESDPERRHLTVMFCDLVGSTALSLSLDPEELREVVRSYQTECAAVIERFGGYIAQYLGDGVLVYFGYPVALEEEADCAVGAGLAILAAIDALGHRLKVTHGIDLSVRIGIHTGVVVVGEVGSGTRREHLALGDTPNIAARLQSLAEPNTVVVSSETYRLVARSFECEALGARTVKGIASQEPVYRVLRERRLPGADGRAASLLGRDHELSVLVDRWSRVQEGEGRVVCISGDPGIGKSHLIAEFKGRPDMAGVLSLDARCLPYYRNTAFHPFADLLQAEVERGPAESVPALTALLERGGFDVQEAMPLYAPLLSATSGRATGGEPPLQKERTKAALVQLLLRASETEPLILRIEDLHWADPSTLEVLDQLMPQVASTRLMLLFTSRPEFGVRWAAEAHVTHMYLGRLNRQQVETLVLEVAGGKALPGEVMVQIAARTDGVPLFVEELTRMVLESGLLSEADGRYELRGPLPPLAIPTTLRDSLEARLEKLSSAKEIVQLCATIGREFSYPLLRAVCGTTEDALQSALAELVDAGLLYVRGTPPNALYSFKQGLIQEAAYQSLLRSSRQRQHQRIAAALEQGFPEIARLQPELVAFHYTAAGAVEPAIAAWLRAGRRALERSANAEAVAHLTQGLELSEQLPVGSARDDAQLELLSALAPALAGTLGYMAEPVRDTLARARELCEKAKRTEPLTPVLVGLFAFHFVRAELGAATSIAQELMELLERALAEGPVADSAELALAANAATGVAALAAGRLATAHDHLERVVRAYDADRHGPLAVRFSQDFGVVALAYSGLLLWITGCPDQARRRVTDALELAERIRHPHSLALALSIAGSVHQLSRQPASVREFATRLQEVAAQHGFRHWSSDARALMAWVAAQEGRVREALAVMEAELSTFRAGRSLMPYQYYHRIVAELYVRLGRPADALELLDDVGELIRRTGEQWWWESEIYRLRAEIALMLDEQTGNAEQECTHALEVARSRRARSLELRAALTLARLWRERGRTEDARALLADCYEGFTEGFETRDLLDTRALLEELETPTVAEHAVRARS